MSDFFIIIGNENISKKSFKMTFKIQNLGKFAKKFNMKKYYFIFIFLILTACGVKQTQNLLSSGNYDEAINNSISDLRTNRDKKGSQDYVYLL